LALPRTPCAFRLRQARTVSAAESDVPCRNAGAVSSVPLPEPTRPEVPKHTRALCLSAEPSRQDRLYRAPFKVTRYAQSRTPSTDSIPTLRSEVVGQVNDVRHTSTRPGHPVSRAVAARPVMGLPGRRAALLRSPLTRPSHLRGPILRAPLGEDASCQSLQPTSCQRAPAGSLDSRARGLRLSDRTLSAPPHRSPHRRAGDETEPSATAPVDRVNGFSGLE
jgi:hypothetical protein